jgi:LDH2 family malate/lactate/ureidoglycolate dehydrogenase
MEYCVRALCSVSASTAEAETIARVLTNADERGVHSHGVVRVEGYAACLRSGGIKGNVKHRIVSEGASFALIDACGGLGIPVSVEAEELAVQKAKQTGIGIVNVRGSHHHGACGYYSIHSAKQGLIGLAMSTGDIIMAATGAAEDSIGNNPFSYALPAGKFGVICYDIAMSTVAMGKVAMAADEGRSIPLGWMLDSLGNPTTDPWSYANGGTMVPFGGYKGYGLSMMVESLAGILSGAALLKDIHAWNKDPERNGNVGHCFIAIDPSHINPDVEIPERAEEMIEQLRAHRRAPGVDHIYFPGEIEQDKEKDAQANGIPLPPASEHALERCAEITDVPFDRNTMLRQSKLSRGAV